MALSVSESSAEVASSKINSDGFFNKVLAIAIARTLLKNPSLLIFDEATSALDSETERAIQKELIALAQNRSTLIIAHRLSTIIHAQQILVMDDGCIIEKGTHEELLAHGGRYAEMWRVQQSQIELIS